MVGGMANTHTQTHTHSVPRDKQGGWSLGRESDAILTHEGMAYPLTKRLGNEHREDVVGVGEQAMANTHSHTQCPW